MWSRRFIGRDTLHEAGSLNEVSPRRVITRAWVVKAIILYALLLAAVWYLGWRYLGSGMTH